MKYPNSRSELESFFVIWAAEFLQSFVLREQEKLYESDSEKLNVIANILKELINKW